MQAILNSAAVLIATSDLVMATKIGQIVDLGEITSGEAIDYTETADGTIEFMIHNDLYELGGVAL